MIEAVFEYADVPRIAKRVDFDPPGYVRGDWRLYLTTGGPLPLYVIVSAAEVLGEPETYIFEADPLGNVIEWIELEGSYKGGLDHEQALRRAGYMIESVEHLALPARQG